MDERNDPREALTRDILERTSGSPCGRLHALACDFVDGGLDAARESLVRAHLERCAACAALVAALSAQSRVLPALAQVDPGPGFTQGVLRSTSRRAVAPRFEARAAWSRLMRRPRIALETAYLGAAAGLIGLHAPVPWHRLEIPAVVRASALRAPAARVMEGMVEGVVRAERRATAPLHRALGLRAEASPARLWQRVSARARGWILRLENILKPSKPANP